MRIGASLFLIAVGAILTWAVTARVSGINVQVVGVILMVVGIAGLILDLALWAQRRRTTVVTRAPGATYVDQYVDRIDPVDRY